MFIVKKHVGKILTFSVNLVSVRTLYRMILSICGHVLNEKSYVQSSSLNVLINPIC